MKNLRIREMKPSEMRQAIYWAKREGWNPGLYDEKCFHIADPNGYFVGEINGEVVSMISAVKYGMAYGFLGFYIVDPNERAKGFGIEVWKKALAYLDGRLIGLDGVPEQVRNYEKSGFVFEHRNITFKGKSIKKDYNQNEVVDLTIDDFEMIKKYDGSCFPDNRDAFLKCWIGQTNSHTLGFLKNGKLLGYGKIRHCPEAYKIGPLFADDEVIAEKLFRGLQSKIPLQSDFTMDIPEPNKKALFFTDKYKMEYFFETARMYKGGIPKIDLNKIFGITSYELG
jgi:hypothetical protein